MRSDCGMAWALLPCYLVDLVLFDAGYVGIDEYECESKGCCWEATTVSLVCHASKKKKEKKKRLQCEVCRYLHTFGRAVGLKVKYRIYECEVSKHIVEIDICWTTVLWSARASNIISLGRLDITAHFLVHYGKNICMWGELTILVHAKFTLGIFEAPYLPGVC